MNIPNDPVMLLSYINTQLRDFYPTLNELCSALNLSKDELCSKLSAIDYEYDEEANQFVYLWSVVVVGKAFAEWLRADTWKMFFPSQHQK